jgi:hypothetical protein
VSAVISADADGLSAAIDLADEALLAIRTPATWTTADLTFMASDDGVTYYDLHEDGGTEVTIASANMVVDRFIGFSEALSEHFRGIRYLKLRSGVSATPVQQAAARTVPLIVRQST